MLSWMQPRALAAAEFPSLSNAVAPLPTDPPQAAAGPGGYAAALKARGGTAGTAWGRAGATTPAAANRATRVAAGVSSAAPARAQAPSAKAPIWEAQGVPRFATGAQNAAEYAAAREEARDHARLRNMYFQQASQLPWHRVVCGWELYTLCLQPVHRLQTGCSCLHTSHAWIPAFASF